MANTGMNMPTDGPRTEPAASLMTEKQTCAYPSNPMGILLRLAGTFRSGPLLGTQPPHVWA